MRVVFLGNGMTGYLHAQYRALSDLGHELMVVQPGSPDVAVGAMRDTAFGDLNTGEFATYLGWSSGPDRDELAAKVLEFAPAAVVMTSWNFSKAYRHVMKRLSPEVVRILVMDNLWRSAPKQWAGRLIHRWYVDTVADAAMVPSFRTEQYARMLGFSAADIIRGSLSADVDLFGSPERSGAELAARRSFLYVGRLVEHKGPDVLADAYRRYRELVEQPWDLDVVGTGPMASLFDSLSGVRLRGFLAPEPVAELMRQTSCYVLPSRIEPYGVVLHEAAAAGLPILSSEFAGAAPSFVQDGVNGWTVPAGDPEALARAMERLSALDETRMAEMSAVSRGLALRTSPQGWARNLSEEIERRSAAGGGRLG